MTNRFINQMTIQATNHTKDQMQRDPDTQKHPLIAITADLMVRNGRPTAFSTMTYSRAIERAGGIAVILPPMTQHSKRTTTALLSSFDGFILSGGDDPQMESFGTPTHQASTLVLPDRQSFETNLIQELNARPEIPVLGICLGMQMLALCNNGQLNQHLPDTHEDHQVHWEHDHEIISIENSILPSGTVYSKHRQAVSDPGKMRVIATSHDDIIEAIDAPDRAFTLGVQWHPERTENDELGQGLIDQLVEAARIYRSSDVQSK
jgi:putative glutamine amidotransferase